MARHFLIDQETQTELIITEPDDICSEQKYQNGDYETTSKKEFPSYKLRKSASFSSSSGNSMPSSLSSAYSSTSLRSSPLRASMRTLKSDTINTFQKWETTIESVSFVTTKTIAIAEYPTDDERFENDDKRATRTPSALPTQKQQSTSSSDLSKTFRQNGISPTPTAI